MCLWTGISKGKHVLKKSIVHVQRRKFMWQKVSFTVSTRRRATDCVHSHNDNKLPNRNSQNNNFIFQVVGWVAVSSPALTSRCTFCLQKLNVAYLVKKVSVFMIPENLPFFIATVYCHTQKKAANPIYSKPNPFYSVLSYLTSILIIF